MRLRVEGTYGQCRIPVNTARAQARSKYEEGNPQNKEVEQRPGHFNQGRKQQRADHGSHSPYGREQFPLYVLEPLPLL